MAKRPNTHLALNLPLNKRSGPSPSPALVGRSRPEAAASTSTIESAQPQLQQRIATPNSQSSTAEGRQILQHVDPAESSSLPSDIDDRGRSITRTGKTGSKCFRIANVPPDWNKDTLLAVLETIDPFIEENPELSLYPCLDSIQTQTALLNLRTCTEYFQRLKPNDFNHVPILNTGSRGHLVIDSHFYNLTPLNSPEGEVVAELVSPCLIEF